MKEVGGRLVTGPTKTRAYRRLTLPAWLAATLDEYLAPPPTLGPDAPLFLAPEGGRVRHGLFRRRQYRPAVRASLPPELHGVRWHDLRHTHASMLISAGAPITAVSARLGHASTRMTLDVYGHMMPGEDAALADRLPAPDRRVAHQLVPPAEGVGFRPSNGLSDAHVERDDHPRNGHGLRSSGDRR